MRIALAAAAVKDNDVEYNISAMRQMIEKCRGRADLVVFGESVLQGFNSLVWEYERDWEAAVSQTDSCIQKICRIAKENGAAVSFGYIEKDKENLFSSQIVIDNYGKVIHNFRRVSVGWKPSGLADARYCEGQNFEVFSFQGKTFGIGLCGDLWTDGRPEEMKRLNADVVLWPVNCDFEPEEWNRIVKEEYARQAAFCGERVLYVNPVCASQDAEDCSTGGAAYFQKGVIEAELAAGEDGVLIVEI